MSQHSIHREHVKTDTNAAFDAPQLQADFILLNGRVQITEYYRDAQLRYPHSGEPLSRKVIEQVASSLLALEALRQQRIVDPVGHDLLLRELLADRLPPADPDVAVLKKAVDRWRMVAMTAIQAAASLVVLGLIVAFQ